MTLVSDIIHDAYRESNLIAITATPTSVELTEGLRLLNRIHASVYGNGAGEKLETLPIGQNNIDAPSGFPDDQWITDTDWFIPLNSRVITNLQGPTTISLHPIPQAGSRFAVLDASDNLATYPLTVQANGRTIEGLDTLVINQNGFTGTWFYRDDTGDWQRVPETLALDDTWPFPLEFDSMFVTMLAMRFNPRNGVQADPHSVEEYRRTLRQFRARYSQRIQTGSEPGLVRLSRVGMNHFYGGYGNATADFNVGIPWRW